MERRHILLSVILLILAAFSMKATTPEPFELLTISADAALTTDVDYGDAFIRPDGFSTSMVSRASEDASDPEIDVEASDTAILPPSPDRKPVSHRSSGTRRAILRVYRI